MTARPLHRPKRAPPCAQNRSAPWAFLSDELGEENPRRNDWPPPKDDGGGGVGVILGLLPSASYSSRNRALQPRTCQACFVKLQTTCRPCMGKLVKGKEIQMYWAARENHRAEQFWWAGSSQLWQTCDLHQSNNPGCQILPHASMAC